MDNTLIYIIFNEDLSFYTQREEPTLRQIQAVVEGISDILRVEKDGRVCRYIEPVHGVSSYWEEIENK